MGHTISVVIPAYNAGRFLGRSVGSALAQSRAADEIIVVDDASTDGTADIAQRLGARVIRREQNGGESAARNDGIAAAKSEWIALLDADDEWAPAFLEEIESLINEYPEIPFIFTSYERVTPDGKRSTEPFSRVPTARGIWSFGDYVSYFARYNSPPMCSDTVTVRRDLLIQIGGFADTRRGADTDMWLRLFNSAGAAAYSTRALATYHQHRGSVTYMIPPMRGAEIATIHQLASQLPAEEARALRRMLNIRLFRAARVFADSDVRPSYVVSDFFPRDNPWMFAAVRFLWAVPPAWLRPLRRIVRTIKALRPTKRLGATTVAAASDAAAQEHVPTAPPETERRR